MRTWSELGARVTVAALLAMAVALGGCGGGSDSDSDGGADVIGGGGPDGQVTLPDSGAVHEDAGGGSKDAGLPGDDACTPTCGDAVCGDDGCGGSCGSCADGETCEAGACTPDCVPSCGDAVCGDDGCGGSCGTCADGESCEAGACVPDCVPSCGDAECGDDGCGGSCGSCPEDAECEAGVCVGCEPSCGDAVCGDDGCGGTCGMCADGESCDAGVCVPDCVSSCGDAECGDDGCGGSCGSCPEDAECEAGVCVGCEPSCGDAVCGDDGCGGTCGMCADGESCEAGVCVPDCVPSCGDAECGDDGCGGSCGTCPEDASCEAGVCVGCEPSCGDAVCGDDGCGGTCGMCGDGETCDEGVCVCVPDCAGRCCGDDGCGGTCEDACGDAAECDLETCECLSLGGSCGMPPEWPVCDTLAPAPTASADVSEWVRTNAVPVLCDGEWDFAVFGDEFRGHSLFLFGEVHGSSELGPWSADLFEYLVRQGRVNKLTMEVGFDLTDALNEYIQTGGGALVSTYNFNQFAEPMFIRTLTERARALYLEGFEVEAFGIDTPMRIAYVNEEIERVAESLDVHRGLVLDTLPSAPSMGEFLQDAQVAAAESYKEHIHANLDTICEELSDEDCAYLGQLGTALYIGSFSQSWAMYMGDEAAINRFFHEREPFIYYNYAKHMATEEALTYSHMGAAHTAKSDVALAGVPSCAQRMDTLHGPTLGKVYSTTPSYGSGSSIWYGWVTDIPAEPPAIANALQSQAMTRYFVSTHYAGEGCVESPLLDLESSDIGAGYAESYDAYTWVKRITPEQQGGWGKTASDLGPGAARILGYLEAVRRAESRLIQSVAQ